MDWIHPPYSKSPMDVLVSLTQLVWTMHNNMQGPGFKPWPPQKKKFNVYSRNKIQWITSIHLIKLNKFLREIYEKYK